MSEPDPAFTVGSLECRVVPDGVAQYEKEALYADVPPEELEPSVRALLDDKGYVPLPYHPLLVRTADGIALVDAGAGPALANEWGDPIGRLREACAPRTSNRRTSGWCCFRTLIPTTSEA
jgi:hypothetical protein